MQFMDLWPITVTRPDSHLKVSTGEATEFMKPQLNAHLNLFHRLHALLFSWCAE
jgi:hypothetical protein